LLYAVVSQRGDGNPRRCVKDKILSFNTFPIHNTITTIFLYVLHCMLPWQLMDAAIYYTSATISGCFSGLIAYGVTKNLEGVHGRHSRQWLYIIEAIPAIALGLLFLVCFPSFPEKVVKSGHRLFSAEELLLIEQRNNSSENSAPCGRDLTLCFP
jgi:hypothetical protein